MAFSRASVIAGRLQECHRCYGYLRRLLIGPAAGVTDRPTLIALLRTYVLARKIFYVGTKSTILQQHLN